MLTKSNFTFSIMSAEVNKQRMIKDFERALPDFAKMIRSTTNEAIVFHQDAFAADYQDEEFRLLGMAIKYAGLNNREVHIIPGNR